MKNVKDGDTFMTGAGLQLDDVSDDEGKGEMFPFEDEPVDEVMEIIKRDVFKMKNVTIFSKIPVFFSEFSLFFP